MRDNNYIYEKINKIELLHNSETETDLSKQEQEKFIPDAKNVDFIERGKMVIRVMDNHNFYEAEGMSEEYLKDAPIGLLTKIWISISRSLKE